MKSKPFLLCILALGCVFPLYIMSDLSPIWYWAWFRNTVGGLLENHPGAMLVYMLSSLFVGLSLAKRSESLYRKTDSGSNG